VDGFEGTWSLLLPPDYRQCRARPLEEIAAFQWEARTESSWKTLKRWIQDDGSRSATGI